MNDQVFSVSVDSVADAAYIRMSSAPVAVTRDVSDTVSVDLDQFGVVVGIELLALDAEIPFSRLRTEFHVPSAAVEKLRRLRPTVAISLKWGYEGTAVSSRATLTQV